MKSVLLVDDDANLLASLKRDLGDQFEVETALGGQDALDLVKGGKRYALVIADMVMPGLDGIQLFKELEELTPDTIRIMLTGNADLSSAIDAVNQGRIFRFLTKPCPRDVIISAANAAIKQYNLVTADKELLQKTLVGSVRLLTEITSLVSQTAMNKAMRIRKIVSHVARDLALENTWQFELAASLSQLGLIRYPPELIDKIASSAQLTVPEKRLAAEHPQTARRLLLHIPRMELIARMVEDQNKEMPDLKLSEKQGDDYIAAYGAHLLHAALEYDRLSNEGWSHSNIISFLRKDANDYEPRVLDSISKMQTLENTEIELRSVDHIDVGMVLAEDVVDATGEVVVAAGQELSYALLSKLFKLAQRSKYEKRGFKVHIR